MSNVPRRQDGPRPGPPAKQKGPVHDALFRLSARLRLSIGEASARHQASADLAVVAAAIARLRAAAEDALEDQPEPPWPANSTQTVYGASLTELAEALEASR